MKNFVKKLATGLSSGVNPSRPWARSQAVNAGAWRLPAHQGALGGTIQHNT